LEIFAKSKTKLTTQAQQNITKIKKAMGLEWAKPGLLE
jgi:hypothetical protein